MENSKLKILAIDDNPDNLITMRALVQEAFSDALIFTATSGKLGIELAKKQDPDVILLDIVMPEIDGYEVCKKLKSDDMLKDIPIIFVTALKVDRESRLHAVELGAEAFIAKPIDKVELSVQIRAMAKIKRANLDKQSEKTRLSELVRERTKELENTNVSLSNLLGDLKKEIEARKKIENELRASEELFRTVVQNSLNLTTLTDENDQLIFASPQGKIVIGIDCTSFIGKKMPLNFHPDDEKFCLKKWANLKTKGETILHAEYRIIDEDGVIRWLSHSALRIMVDGKVKYYQSSIRNITERRALEARKETGIQIQDTLNKILQVSTETIPFEEALKRILQLTFEPKFLDLYQKGGIFLTKPGSEILQLKYSHNLPETLHKMCAEVPFGHCHCGRAASSAKIQFSHCLDERHDIRYDEITPHGHYNVPILSDKTVLGVLVVYLKEGHVNDPVEVNFLNTIAGIIGGLIIRNNLFEELKDSEYYLKKSQQYSNIGSYLLDIKKGIWKASGELHNIFGMTDKDEHTIEAWVSIVHPEQQDMMLKYFQNEVLAKKQRFSKEYKIVNKSKDTNVWVHGIGELEMDENGNPIRMIGTIQDISERKKAEELILQKSTDLQRFIDTMVGRELKMIELKKEINDLLKKTGEKEKYKIVG